MHIFSASILFASCVLLTSCGKEALEPSSPLDPLPSSQHLIPVGNGIEVTVSGQVFDEQGAPIVGATVQAGYGSQTTQTDVNGAFTLASIMAYEKLGYVRVSRAGYFNGSRSFLPRPGTNVVRITLLDRTVIGTVQALAGGSVAGESTVLTFSPGGFIRDGQPYDGVVHVALNRIDPESDVLHQEMPGALLGAMNGEAMVLLSYGMVAVELTDPAGSEVQLAADSPAEVRFPVAGGQLGSAPAVIDLWSFNATLGYWVKEGTAQLTEGRYVAHVGHFSFWNCDVPGGAASLSGQVVDDDGNGLQGARITITSATSGTGVDHTSTSGHFGGLVPRDQFLTLKVEVQCAGVFENVLQSTIGPFSSATILPPTVVVPSSTTTLTGSVTGCGGSPVTAGYVVFNGQVHFCNGGQFSFVACNGQGSMMAFDQQNLTMSNTQDIMIGGGVQDLGEIQACEGSVSTGTVNDIDGNSYTTVMIGGMEWMAGNLRTTRYANGDAIQEVTINAEWASLGQGAWKHYNNDPQYEEPFGKLYNWHAVSDPRNTCPAGWHVATEAEFDVIIDQFGGQLVAGAKLKAAGTIGSGTGYWSGGTGTNESGFTGQPGGGQWSNGSYNMYDEGLWWTATEHNLGFARFRGLFADSSLVNASYHAKTVGMSVRCVRDQ